MSTESQHWEEQEKKNKQKGMIGSIIAHSILLLLMILLAFKFPDPPPPEEGILINFGSVDAGSGTVQPKIDRPVEQKPDVQPTPPQPQPEVQEQPVQTQDVEEAPSMEEVEDPIEEPVEQPVEEPIEDPVEEPTPDPVEEEVKEPEPVVDPELQAMMDKTKNQSQGDGNTNQTGDQGAPNGDPNSDNYDGDQSYGQGDQGVGWSLDGRSFLGIPDVNDQSQKTGTVVIEIRVNQQGEVVSAKFKLKGSTTQDSQLIALAKKAALDAKFNADPSAPDLQIGSITFTFKLK